MGVAGARPRLGLVLEHLKTRPDVTCYAALLEALTGIWNAAARGAGGARVRGARPAAGAGCGPGPRSPARRSRGGAGGGGARGGGGSARTGRAAGATMSGAAAARDA